MKVLVLGADGFIGRHVAFALRVAGHEVIAVARKTDGLAAMGFATLKADLTDPVTHDPAFWGPLRDGAALVNAAGLLTGTEAAFAAVHQKAPQAAYSARAEGAPAILISAVGIDNATTSFARWRRAGEAVAQQAGVSILRPGLVLADTSYGGSSLIRALAAFPLRSPVVGDGSQPFNPIHAKDLAAIVAACLEQEPGPGPWDVGGPETIGQADLIALTRRWLGLGPAKPLPLPLPLARGLGRIGDWLSLGPVSANAVAQLQEGVLADPAALLAQVPIRPQPVSQFLFARPAGTQDIWHARLFLLKPLIRFSLAALWLVSGLLGLLLAPDQFLPAVGGGLLPDPVLVALARFGGLADLGLALALILNWRPRLVGLFMLGIVGGYTVGLSLIAPCLWLDPFGGLLKNLPILALMLVHLALVKER